MICAVDVYLHPWHSVKISGHNYQDLPTCQTAIGLFPHCLAAVNLQVWMGIRQMEKATFPEHVIHYGKQVPAEDFCFNADIFYYS